MAESPLEHRFWRKGSAALRVSLVVSAIGHGASLMPSFNVPQSVEVNDFEGEAAIPIDVLEQGSVVAEPPPPPEPPPIAPVAKTDEPKDPTAAALASRPDAGAPRDAATDSARDAMADAPLDAAGEGGAQVASEAIDAGEAGAGPQRDPQALLASSGAVQAEVIYVTVVINAIEIRKNPASAQLGGLLRSIPDWDDFMRGTESLIDPVKDTDWILISGPSLRDSKEDAVTMHYAIADAKVDQAVAIVSSHYEGKGGPYDAGVAGTRAWLAHADFAERVIERPRSHVLVIVPPKRAQAVAKQLVRAKSMPQNIMPGVAVFVRVVDPHHALPNLIPEGVTEARLRLVSNDDASADITIDLDCPDTATATRASAEVTRTIAHWRDTIGVGPITHHLLDGAEVTGEGTLVRVRVHATQDQIEANIAAAKMFMPAPRKSP